MICVIKAAFSEKNTGWCSIKDTRASQDKVFWTWTSYDILNRTTLIYLTSSTIVFFCYANLINVIAISFPSFVKFSVTLAESKHQSYLSLNLCSRGYLLVKTCRLTRY